jgi:hypothetical protein
MPRVYTACSAPHKASAYTQVLNVSAASPHRCPGRRRATPPEPHGYRFPTVRKSEPLKPLMKSGGRL